MEQAAGKGVRIALVLMGSAALAACATTAPRYSTRASAPSAKPATGAGGTYKVGAPYQVGGVWYVPREQPNYDETGVASWYGDEFHMKATANGELFDKDAVSGAHTTLPLPSLVEVTNLDNGRKLVVRVNDRGPFVDGRIIDLSREAARELGYERQGLARVRVRYVGPAPLPGEDSRRYARYTPPATPAPAAAAPPPAPPQPPGKEPDVVFVSTPLPKPPSAMQVAETTLAPLPPTKPPAPAPVPTPSPSVVASASAPLPVIRPVAAPQSVAAASSFRVQAGAFSSEENARRAVIQLAAAGPAVIEPITRNGLTLYRVVLDGAPDQDHAEVLREKAAEAGFADARVIRPF